MADRESAHIQVGILTVSDSCFNGTAIDRSGESLKQLVESGKLISGTVVTKDILPDEFDQIKAKLLHWSDHLKLDLILTTGGTGFSLRDVTPEATKAVLEREALGMTVAMLKGSLDITPLAMLTRLACGTRGRTLIINLPGSTKGSVECFEIASKGIPHAVDLLRGHKQGVEKTHSALQSEGIRSAHGSHHHQLPLPLTQAQRVETVPTKEPPPAPRAAPATSSYSPASTSHPLLHQKLSLPVLELDMAQTTTVTSTKKATKTFTSIVPDSPPAPAPASTTLHFWRTLLSLSEAARMDLINLVPQTSSSHQTVTASLLQLPASTIPIMSSASIPTFQGSTIPNISLASVQTYQGSTIPNISASNPTYQGSTIPNISSASNPTYQGSTIPNISAPLTSTYQGSTIPNISSASNHTYQGSTIPNTSMVPTPTYQGSTIPNASVASIPTYQGSTVSITSMAPTPTYLGNTIPIISTASISTYPNTLLASIITYPGLFLHDKGSLTMPGSATLQLSTNISADSNSCASIQTLPSAASSAGTQPTFADATLHHQNKAPSLLPTSVALSRGDNLSLHQVPSSVHPFAASILDSQYIGLTGTHTQRKLPLDNNKMGEPPEDKYDGLKNNLPMEERVGKSGSLFQVPSCVDSTTCFSTSPRISSVPTSSYRSAIACYDTVKNIHQHAMTYVNKDCLLPTSIVPSSNNLSSRQDNLASKYVNTSHDSFSRQDNLASKYVNTSHDSSSRQDNLASKYVNTSHDSSSRQDNLVSKYVNTAHDNSSRQDNLVSKYVNTSHDSSSRQDNLASKYVNTSHDSSSRQDNLVSKYVNTSHDSSSRQDNLVSKYVNTSHDSSSRQDNLVSKYVNTSHDSSSRQDNLASKYVNTPHDSDNTQCITQNNLPVYAASAPKVEILLENLRDSSHLVCTRERKPIVDCSGNPLVQILLPCSKHVHSKSPGVQNLCTPAVTHMKNSSLRSIVRKNRTRILNILKKQNKIRKAYVKEVKMSSNNRFHHASQLAAKAEEVIDASLDIDIENEDTVNDYHQSLYLTNSGQLRNSSQMQDVAAKQTGELKTYNTITAERHEIFDMTDAYTHPGDELSDDAGAGLTRNQYQETSPISTRKFQQRCSDNESPFLPNKRDSQNYLETLRDLSKTSAVVSCENDHTLPCPTSTLSLIAKWSASPVKGMATIKSAKIHNVRQQGDLFYVPVGKSFQEFIKEHPMIQGIYLHKGKREIKKQLAQLCRQYDVTDKMTTWRRGSEILERNCFDDYFELTEAGKKEQEEVLSSRKRDQYIVNWYVWCPGHGNCRRKCGGYGGCAHGCQGMQHKQDRHNCSLMVNMKLLLSDLSTWRVNITGTHVPCESGMTWSPPVAGCKLNNQSAKNYHSMSDVTKHKRIFHPKKAAMDNARMSNWRGATALTTSAPDVWSIIEASDEPGMLTNPDSASPKSDNNLRTTSVEANTSIPTKKRISKMLSSLKRRREERMTTYKLLSGSTKNMCSSLSTINERQTVAGSCEYMKNNNRSIEPIMNETNINYVFDSSTDLKCRSVYKKDTVTVSFDDVSKSVLNRVSSFSNKINTTSTQGQLLSSELLHFLTCNLPQNTPPTPVISSTGGVNLISHKQTLPSGYSNFLENTLTSESDYAIDLSAVFGSPDGKNLEVSPVDLSSLSNTTVDLDKLSSVDSEQPEMLQNPTLKSSSCLQEDLVSSTGSNVQCKEDLNSSEIFSTLSFDQPFLSDNTLGEILQQASVDFNCNFEEETDNCSVCMDTSLSDFSSLDNLSFSEKCQSDQSQSVHQQYAASEQTYQHAGTSNGSQSPVLQHFSEEETEQFLVPGTDSVILDSLIGLSGLLPLSESATSNEHIYPTNTITAGAHPSCPALSTSEISSPAVSPHYFSHETAASTEGFTEHGSSSCENFPAQMEELLPTLPSYREATLALAEQLSLNQSVNPL